MRTKTTMLNAFALAAFVLCFFACKKSTPPTVTISDNISVTQTSANVTGEVTDEGSSPVTERGFIYGKQGESRQDTMYCGSGVGTFPTRLTGLEPNTTYNCFAFARNDGSIGTSGKVTFTTRDHDLPIVNTSEVENVGTMTASCGGNVTDDGGAEITERGVCWSTSHSPTVSGSHASSGDGLGEFTCNMTNLSANTTYYVRAYAKNSKGVAYGEERDFSTLDFDLPEVTTAPVTDITQTSAKGGGEVTDGGGTTVTERGICWSTSHNPTVSSSHANSGTGMGTFTCNITGLNPDTKYYVRAYATNSRGTAYGEEKSFTSSAIPPDPPTVSTGAVTDITTTTAKGSGNVTDDGGSDITERGLCFSTNHNPTTGGLHVVATGGTGNFTALMTELAHNTTYYVRAYAINVAGTSYGDEVEFSTLSISVPAVTTASVTNIGQTTATGGGNVISDGGATVTERGICWSTSHNPTISGNHASSGTGTGSYTVNMTNLTLSNTYYVRAYAINSQGVAYGEEVNFTTNSAGVPSVTTSAVTNITQTTATCGGNVTSNGGAAVTRRGVCWSTNPNPTTNNQCTNDGTGTGSFTSSITGLSMNTTYYVRAYATNSAGTSYGEQKTFTTNGAGMPTVTTNSISNITQTSATCGGNVTTDGGATVTSRGVCWSTSQNPTINNQHTNNGTGTGSFTSNITGLSANTYYYVRAYATNSHGTAYGEQRNFKTSPTAPTVTTSQVSNITQTSASCGGNVTDHGGSSVTARGVCWSTSPNPTINNQHTTNGSGTGSFTSSITNLSPGTMYYVRAYATNSVGTGYGETRTFTTTQSTYVPTVTTSQVTNITQNSATCGGNVVSNGGATVTARGVCWSNTNSLPTISNSHTTNGSGTGSFTSSMTGLNAGTTYYVRSYATNSAGTGYGEVRTFTTVNALEGWLYYGEWNNHWTSWGLTNGGTKEWAVMFPTSILSQYAGTSITYVDAYIGETGTYTLKIYRGGSSQPTTLVWTQSFTVTSTGWNTINISPLTLNTSYNLWVSVTGTHEAGQHPAGSCAGINNPNARWNNDNGTGWTDMYDSNGNVDFCFEIQAWVTDQTKGGKGLEIQLPQTTITPQQTNEIKSSRNPNEGSKKYKR